MAVAAGVAAALLALRIWRRPRRQYILIDGSNVMYWRNETPDIRTVKAVVDTLERAGYRPGVIFDANAGHILIGRYMHDEGFAMHLGLPSERVMVVPKGTQADAYLLEARRDMGAKIVTNDRFRDWADRFPEVAEPGTLVRGKMVGRKLTLDL
nr:hypothetical protein [Maritimibacter sp. DP1N21-5]